ncbi:LPS export ABC transporter periplasmic protein LptC [Methylotuvimicrobium sp. KM1]|uniref:LPS export ABC transporter periplasmic protein LptC n=1 Tax=Methylotuvimicrobium sp. KM1 TaxID=3377707 RepID=UPI00384E2404
MPESNLRLYIYGVLLAIVSWWLLQLTAVDEEVIALEKSPHTVDYFSTGYAKWEMDVTGLLKSKLVADTLTHYNDDGTTHLQKPVMTIMNPGVPPWVIQSETGIVSSDKKLILMNGKAVVAREAGPGSRAMKINSSNVRVQPEINYAETDEWAELLSPPNRTEGIGMKLYYSTPIRIELFSKVRGKYETK